MTAHASPDARLPLPLGTVIAERFELVEMLGAGGMGAVYRARQHSLSRDVAIKVLLPEVAHNGDALARFEREARVASLLRHPNGVEIYDVGEHEGWVYLAMELLRGETLWSHFRAHGNQLGAETALEIARQIADVLTAAHRQNIVHRDLKPENIFLEDVLDSWRVVVVDFGLAFITDEAGSLGRLTREGLVVGTPWYLSPEQAKGKPVGPSSDVYSLGCVLYELVTGDPPFDGNELDVLTQQVYVEAAPPSERAPSRGISPGIDALVSAMLRKDPDARPTAAEVHARLTEIANGRPGGRARDPAAHRPRSERMVATADVARDTLAVQVVAESSTAAPTLVAIVGALATDVGVGLGRNAVQPISATATAIPEAAAAVLVTDPARVDVVMASNPGRPVVAACDVRDMSRVSALMRMGVAEVVRTPLSAEKIAKKLHRAIARHRRKRSR